MNSKNDKKVLIRYFALLREESGKNEESILTSSEALADLFEELKNRYHFRLPISALRVAVNDNFVSWQTKINDGDSIVFIPPVAGG